MLQGVCILSEREYYIVNERPLKPMLAAQKNGGILKPDFELRRKKDQETVFIIEVKKLFTKEKTVQKLENHLIQSMR